MNKLFYNNRLKFTEIKEKKLNSMINQNFYNSNVKN